MKIVKCIIVSLVLVLLSSIASAAPDTGWPRLRTENGNTLITYQPQIDDWKDFKEVDWRMAISLTPAGGKPAVGVVELHGQTTVDNDKKMVLIDNLKIKKINFPSLDSGYCCTDGPAVQEVYASRCHDHPATVCGLRAEIRIGARRAIEE